MCLVTHYNHSPPTYATTHLPTYHLPTCSPYYLPSTYVMLMLTNESIATNASIAPQKKKKKNLLTTILLYIQAPYKDICWPQM
jgi:hypothetical protein